MTAAITGRLAKVTAFYWQSVLRLEAYNKACITEAPDRIAHLRGLRDYDALVGEYTVRRFCVEKAAIVQPRNESIEQVKKNLRASNPANYLNQPQEYIGVDVAVRLLFADGRQVRGLQLASNYGPYLHYLQTSQPGLKMVGIDSDPLAVQYANLIGVNVIRANAAGFPFIGNGFDLVVSHNFLAFNYDEGLGRYRQGQRDTEQFSARVLSEVSRVLRPGGIFISSQEYLGVDQVGRVNLKPHPDFQGSWFDRRETPILEDLQVFKKA